VIDIEALECPLQPDMIGAPRLPVNARGTPSFVAVPAMCVVDVMERGAERRLGR
jgi:hypothetical protein